MDGIELELKLRLLFGAGATLAASAVILRHIFRTNWTKAFAASSILFSMGAVLLCLSLDVRFTRQAFAQSESKAELLADLESAIERWRARPAAIPFSIAVKAVSGCEVIPFDRRSKEDLRLLRQMSDAIAKAARCAYRDGVQVKRVNEFGNRMEAYVRDALRERGFDADVPATRSGARRTSGYPDVRVGDKQGGTIYIECKTYNPKTLGSSYRTFYLSPPRSLGDSKITTDAHHFIVSFQTKRIVREGGTVYVPVRWRIYTTDSMSVHLKYEFNASNRMIYREEALLAEGSI